MQWALRNVEIQDVVSMLVLVSTACSNAKGTVGFLLGIGMPIRAHCSRG